MRRTTLPRRIALTSLASAFALVLTGCGGGDTKSAADPTAASSSTRAGEETSAPVAAGETVDVAEFADRLQAASEEATTATLSMSMDAEGMTLKTQGQIDYSTTPPSMAMTMTNPMGGGEMDIRMVDGVMYLNMGELSGGKFYKLDLDDPNNPLGTDDLTSQMDPVKQFETFKKGAKSVTYVGAEDVDGEELHHYTVVLDTSKIDELADAQSQAPGAKVPATINYDLWLDGDDRMRQVKMDLGDSGVMSMSIDNWGEPVTIEAPTAKEITEMPGT